MEINELLSTGGWMMYVILGVSIVALAVIFDRFILLFIRSRLNINQLLGQVIRSIEMKDYVRAIEICNIRTKHPLPLILKAGLSKSNRREKEIERAMEEEMLRALPSIQRGVGFLGLLGNVATLLGLLGTILGLIQAFTGVSESSASARQQVLAEGVRVAMYTTAYGLMVAVPILFAHQLIVGRVDKLLIQLEEGAASLLLALAGRFSGPTGSGIERERI